MKTKIGLFPLRTAALCVSLAFGASFIAAPAIAATATSAVASHQQLEFEVILPLQNKADLEQLLVQQRDPSSANYHRWLTPKEFKSRYGANADSLARVTQHLKANGLSIVSEHAQGVRVRGDFESVKSALGVTLEVQNARGVSRLVAARGQSVRSELSNEGAVVTAFSTVARHHTHSVNTGELPVNRISANGSYWFTDIKQAYDFPAYPKLSGAGATVAIVMASDVLDSDVAAMFNHEKWTLLTGKPVPTVKRIPILGGAPFSTSNDASFEASLDVQQVTGMAPDATVELYNIPDLSDNSVLTAYQQIVEDNTADVVSSSFGGAEDFYTAAYNNGTDFTPLLQVYEQIFQQGNAQGITFVASSGDSGGLGAPSPDYLSGSTTATFVPGVEHPAVSPSVTGVGGTNLQTTTGQGLNSAYVSENAYGDPEIPYDPYGFGTNVSGGYWGSGGGVSKVFPQPSYQKLVSTGSTTMRTVPDVALMEGGCPGGIAVTPCAPNRSAVVVALGGHFYGAIGTSVSAPQFAGVLALMVQSGGKRLGNVNPLLYQKAMLQARHIGAPVYHTGIQGFNGYEYTAPVYNQVIGVGTPYVRQLLGVPSIPTAGTPQTPTNP